MDEIQEIPEHLSTIKPADFNISRKKWGRGYRYINGTGPISNDNLLQNLKDIAVPATWTQVKLCHTPENYILASGFDGSGKLQYLYHEDYLDHRNMIKFDDLLYFGHTLPRIRRRVRKDLQKKEWTQEKLLALIVKILDKHHLRIGSRVYAKRNGSYGLTTLRKKHISEMDDHIEITYTGKSGQQRNIELTDSRLIKHLEEVADFPGWELFSFKKGQDTISADSKKTNAYIRQISGEDFSARNFRTWAGTVSCVAKYQQAKKIVEEDSRRTLSSVLVELVAEKLGNTPSVCKEYYIHPLVLESTLKEDFDPTPCDQQFMKNTMYRKFECRTMEILNSFKK